MENKLNSIHEKLAKLANRHNRSVGKHQLTVKEQLKNAQEMIVMANELWENLPDYLSIFPDKDVSKRCNQLVSLRESLTVSVKTLENHINGK